MPGFRQGDVVRVPFPYADRSTAQRRPGLVVSNGAVGEHGRLLWIAMITSAANRPWPGDVDLDDGFAEAGLPFPSVVRPCKIASIDARVADRLGHVRNEHLSLVLRQVADYLGFRPDADQSYGFHES